MSLSYEFKIGEKAMYLSQGVGVIETIEKKEIAGSTVDFYVIQICSSGAKLMVPTKSSSTPMRKLIPSAQVHRIFEILQTPTAIPKTTWNRRFRGLCEKLRRGTAIEVAEVFRDLSTLKSEKELSFREKEILEKARDLLRDEISLVANMSIQDVENRLDGISQAQ